MLNITNILKFFSDVVKHDGFILSADTCNPSHIGPKVADVLVKLDPDSFYDIMRERGLEYYDYRWGKDSSLDSDLLNDLWDLMGHVTNVACTYVRDLDRYAWGYSDYDGALLGWFRSDYDLE